MASDTNRCEMRVVADDVELDNTCGCYKEETSHFFVGVMIAVPAGLMVWAGALRVAMEIAHRL